MRLNVPLCRTLWNAKEDWKRQKGGVYKEGTSKSVIVKERQLLLCIVRSTLHQRITRISCIFIVATHQLQFHVQFLIRNCSHAPMLVHKRRLWAYRPWTREGSSAEFSRLPSSSSKGAAVSACGVGSMLPKKWGLCQACIACVLGPSCRLLAQPLASCKGRLCSARCSH